MGIGGGFWDVLRPIAHSEDLSSLRGKKLAIDLSFWMIQQQRAVKGSARNAHIRLTFFRVINLVARVGALPIFVVDGNPPPLKIRTRMERFSRLSGFTVPLPSKDISTSQEVHSRNYIFTNNVEECVILLELLGMPVLRAKWEAEELCAELDRENIADACVTPDSDAFLHGARNVIKYFQADFREPLVETYRAEEIKSSLGLGRNHLLALALLVGCDYDIQGVPGVGCRTAVRLIRSFPEEDVLDELRAWGKGKLPSIAEMHQYDSSESESEKTQQSQHGTSHTCDKSLELSAHVSVGASGNGLMKCQHCCYCGHPGNIRLHMKSGCQACRNYTSKGIVSGCIKKHEGFTCNCSICAKVQRRKKRDKVRSWWLNIFKRVVSTEGFPNEEIIEAFLHCDASSVAESVLTWKIPDMERLENFLADKLSWNSVYVRQKTLPLLSFFCLRNIRDSTCPGFCKFESLLHGEFFPHSIVRIKILHSRKLYMLRWEHLSGSYPTENWLGLNFTQTPNFSMDSDKAAHKDIGESISYDNDVADGTLCFTTLEEMDLVNAACPELVKIFEEQVAMKKANKNHAKRKREKELPSTGKQLKVTSFFKATASKLVSKNIDLTTSGDGNCDTKLVKDTSARSTEQSSRVVSEEHVSLQSPSPRHEFLFDGIELVDVEAHSPICSPCRNWSENKYPQQMSTLPKSDKHRVILTSSDRLKTNMMSDSRTECALPPFSRTRVKKNLAKAFQLAGLP